MEFPVVWLAPSALSLSLEGHLGSAPSSPPHPVDPNAGHFNELNVTLPSSFIQSLIYTVPCSDLKGGKTGFRPLYIAEIGDTIGEISNGASGPLVNVLLHGLKVIPQSYTVTQSFCVGLYSL